MCIYFCCCWSYRICLWLAFIFVTWRGNDSKINFNCHNMIRQKSIFSHLLMWLFFLLFAKKICFYQFPIFFFIFWIIFRVAVSFNKLCCYSTVWSVYALASLLSSRVCLYLTQIIIRLNNRSHKFFFLFCSLCIMNEWFMFVIIWCLRFSAYSFKTISTVAENSILLFSQWLNIIILIDRCWWNILLFKSSSKQQIETKKKQIWCNKTVNVNHIFAF